MTREISVREQLIQDGFYIFPDILDGGILRRLREATDALLVAQSEEERQRQRSTGSMVPLHKTDDAVFPELIVWPPALAALRSLGYEAPTYTDGYIISKPPDGPRLFWHYDWFAWDDPSAFEPEPPQLFFMYYLTDTTRENGCLRVIPGSHIQHNMLHDLLGAPHSEDLARGDSTDRPEFTDRPDEIDVPIRAGDLLIGDARILHAAHTNASKQRRTLLTLWYQPRYAELSEPLQAQLVKKTQPISASWPPQWQEEVRRLNPVYHGSARPYERTLYHKKGAA